MPDTAVHESPSTAKSLWQKYRIFEERLELDTHFGPLRVPFDEIERVDVSESDVKGLLRGDLRLRGFRPALKVDWANFVEHVVVDKRDGVRRILFTPEDPERFVRILEEAIARRRASRSDGEATS